MTGNPMGVVKMQVGGETYRLHLGMSILAEVQAEFGQAFDDLISGQTADGALPNFKIVHAILAGALRRYHPEQADDAFFVDDLIAENPGVFGELMMGASPPAEPSAGGKAKPRQR
jgi:hypothetical protein